MSNTNGILSEIHSRLRPECDRVEFLPKGLAFLLSIDPEQPDPKVFGTVTLDTCSPAPDAPIQLLTVEFLVFQDLPAPLPEQTLFRLHELSGMALFGTLMVNRERQLCYRYTCTVNEYDAPQTAQLFELICYEMLLFLNCHYEYLFLCATNPKQMTTGEYLQHLVSSAQKESEGPYA